MEFRSLHTIETAENVLIRVELAGLASRVFAHGVDTILMGLLMGLAFVLFSLSGGLARLPEVGKTLLPVSMLLIFFGYHIFQEWLWNGRTVGKNLFNIRVARDNGQPIGFWEAFGRNLLRVVDVYLSGIGFICMMCNRQEKRLGDFLAGTIVINDQPLPSLPLSLSGQTDLAPDEWVLLASYQARKNGMRRLARQALTEELCHFLSGRLQRPVETEADLDNLWQEQAPPG